MSCFVICLKKLVVCVGRIHYIIAFEMVTSGFIRSSFYHFFSGINVDLGSLKQVVHGEMKVFLLKSIHDRSADAIGERRNNEILKPSFISPPI